MAREGGRRVSDDPYAAARDRILAQQKAAAAAQAQPAATKPQEPSHASVLDSKAIEARQQAASIAQQRAAAMEEAQRRAALAAQASKETAIEERRKELEQGAQGIRDQAQGFNLESLGLSDDAMAKRAALREQLFSQQQSSLLGRQGAQQRFAEESLQRRLAGGGLRGTGTAERLAQVQERQLAEVQGQQFGELKLNQGQQELAALDKETDLRAQAQLAINQMQQRAESLATQLVESGVESERARQFAADQSEKERAFKQDVLLAMQQEQFQQNLAATYEQLRIQADQLDLDRVNSEFNKTIAEAEASRRPGIFGEVLGALF